MNTFALSMKTGLVCLAMLGAAGAGAQEQNLKTDLEASLRELSDLQRRIGEEKIPMVKGLNALEDKLMEVRLEHQKVMRQLDSRNLDLNNLRSEIATRRQEKTYISNLLSEYSRNFESRLHITELQLYRDIIRTANLAPDNSNLSDSEIYLRQAELVEASIRRLSDMVGGAAFMGTAAGEDGLLKHGQFLLIGPVALYMSDDAALAGLAEQRLGSLEPAIVGFDDPQRDQMVRVTVSNKTGLFPFDPTLGSARRIEETKDSLVEHIKKGGPVMWPIMLLLFASLIVTVIKWIQLALVRVPSDRQIEPLLNLVSGRDEATLTAEIKKIPGPVGPMLLAGVEHLKEPKELVEEVMFEKLLTTRLRLQKFTTFISVCSAAAPLLGLLGTVTGIINTFNLITVFGSSDPKTLSGGISEALITTEYGLIVAIPSLLFYAFLSRKTKGITDRMEQIAILFMNRANRSE